MNKKYHFLLLGLFFSAVACSNKEGKAVLSIANNKINLSVIPFDSTYTISYCLVNIGKGLLIIDTVTASCGCTVPSLMKSRIEPADSSILIVRYKPVDTGYFDKKVVIKSNIDSTFSIVSFMGRAIK